MQIRALVLAGILGASAPVAGVESANAEEPASALESSGQTTEAAASQPAPAPAPQRKVKEFQGTTADAYSAPPGMEERVIMAGESDSAADFATGDSVAGFDASDLEALGALSVADIGKFTPNLEIVSAGATAPTFFIRGIGLNDFNSNATGAVSIIQDDVALNSPALQLGTIFDMERVNVLRGPIGTGAYRNASAGAIRLYSRRPTGDYNGYLRSSLGEYQYKDFEGAVEAPIWEDILSARFAFRVSQRDGYVENGCGGKPPNAFRGQWTFAQGGFNDDPQWSQCGENVDRQGTLNSDGSLNDGFSKIPAFEPENVNDLNNWAARGTFRFQPTLDQDWLVNAHGARRDQYSTQGISYGTRGSQQYPDGTVINGRLGGKDSFVDGSSRYRRPEVVNMEKRLQALYALTPDTRYCSSPTTCRPRDLIRAAREKAEIAVMNEIATKLDDNPWRGDYSHIGKTTNDTWGINLRGDIALAHDLTFRTVSGYDSYARLVDSDTDQTPNTLFEIKTEDEGWQFYQELGLKGVLTESGAVSWDIGGFYLGEALDVRIDNNFGDAGGAAQLSAREYSQDLHSFATYGKLSYTFLDDFTLDGGARYNWERKVIDYQLVRSLALVSDKRERTRSAPTGEVRLTYNFREDTHAYWKFNRGWKGGHFNATSSLFDGVTYAEPEKNNAYEAGIRGSWFDSRLGLEAALFYYDYDNYQLFTVESKVGSLPEFVVINASAVETLGAEVDLSGRPWNGSFFQVRFGWLDSKFTDFVQTQTVRDSPSGFSAIIRQIDLNYSGNRLLNSPKFKVSLTGEQTVPLGRWGSVTARYDAAWSDTTYYDATEGRGLRNSQGEVYLPEDTIGQVPFWIHNMMVIYRPPVGSIEIQGWVRNFTNQAYKTFAFDASQFQSTTVYFVGEPRMWGMTLLVNF